MWGWIPQGPWEWIKFFVQMAWWKLTEKKAKKAIDTGAKNLYQ